MSVWRKQASGFIALGFVCAPAIVFTFTKGRKEKQKQVPAYFLFHWLCGPVEMVLCSKMVMYVVKPNGWEFPAPSSSSSVSSPETHSGWKGVAPILPFLLF